MKKLSILIIEDEVLIGLALKKLLSQAGYQVCGPAASGEEAIESTRKENPDVVLMDIRLMGAMDGIEAARQIKVFSSAMLIFTTGYQDPDLRERAMALNPTAYIIKPISWRDIDAIIRSNQSTQESPG
jgi:DNA-binding NarL/FixJ family response regulator